MSPIVFEPLTVINGTGEGSGGFLLGGSGNGMGLLAGHGAGSGGFVLRLAGTLEGFDEAIDPEISGFGSGTFYLGIDGQGSSHDVGSGEGGFLLGGWGQEGAQGGITLYLGGSGYEIAPTGAYGFLAPMPPVINAYGDLWFQRVFDQVMLGDEIHLLPIKVEGDRFALSSAPSARFEGTKRADDEVVFTDHTAYVVQLLLSEGVVFSDLSSVIYQQIARAASILVLTGAASNFAEALNQIIDAVAIGGLAEALRKGELTDSVALNAAVAPFYTLIAALLDRIVANGNATGGFTLTALVEDRFLVNADLSNAVELVAMLRDSVAFSFTLTFDNGEYIAWVLNTESEALTRYSNYPFNSFARIGNTQFAAASDGLYTIGGSTDDGENINARLRMGLSDLGTRLLKRVPEAFIAYASDGTMLVMVVTSDEQTGEKAAAYYTMSVRGAAVTRENRVKFGKGLKSVDWDFELQNVAGADFALQSLQFHPIVLDRRTRG